MPKGSEELLDYVNEFLEEEKMTDRIDELAEEYFYRYVQREMDEHSAIDMVHLLHKRYSFFVMDPDHHDRIHHALLSFFLGVRGLSGGT